MIALLPKLPKFLKLPKFPISAPNHTTHPTQKKYGATPDDSIFIIYIGIAYSITTNG